MGATVFAFNEFVTLDTHTCGECGVIFAMTSAFVQGRVKSRETFYCPNGHKRVFTGETEAQRLTRELEREKQARSRAEELRCAALKEARHNQIELRKTKTRLRNTRERIKNGVCPCCHRSFVQLARHMATKHPGFNAEG